MTEFYKPLAYVRTFKAKGVDPERALRMYCTQSHPGDWRWSLQVRAPMSLGSSGSGPDGKDFVIAGASLGVADMIALRNAIDAALSESGALPGPADLMRMLAECEWVGGDDRSDPGCNFCNAVGPHGAPGYVNYRAADPHDADCPLASALGLPKRSTEGG